jgi:hypothetical protein
MVDYIRYIINVGKKKGFTEEQVEAAVRSLETNGSANTIVMLCEKFGMDENTASDLLIIISKELKQLKRESLLRGITFLAFFLIVGVLAFRAQGYWLSYIFFAIAGIKLFSMVRSLMAKN